MQEIEQRVSANPGIDYILVSLDAGSVETLGVKKCISLPGSVEASGVSKSMSMHLQGLRRP
jgi:hypothetical protein